MADIKCKVCSRKQPVLAYVHPSTKQTLRGYNIYTLKEQLAELKKNVTPGAARITAALGASAGGGTSAALKGPATAAASSVSSVDGTPGTFAKCFVPNNVQPGDTLDLKAGPRTVHVIVDAVDGPQPTGNSK